MNEWVVTEVNVIEKDCDYMASECIDREFTGRNIVCSDLILLRHVLSRTLNAVKAKYCDWDDYDGLEAWEVFSDGA